VQAAYLLSGHGSSKGIERLSVACVLHILLPRCRFETTKPSFTFRVDHGIIN
jgi:hypothetical protein